MTEPKWTPGPWKACRSDPAEGADVWWLIAGEGNMQTEIASFSGGYPSERRAATAQLAASAPELYAALAQLLHETVEAGFESARDYNWPKSLADARAALAKAKGETL
jgi:hypothetical protein